MFWIKALCQAKLLQGSIIQYEKSPDSEAGIVMVMVYYSERISIKISKGKRCIGETRKHKLPVVFSQCNSTKSLISPKNEV